MNKPIDGRSMATRLQIIGDVSIADLEMNTRKSRNRINDKYSPKGLLIGKYFFCGDLEENQWNSSNKFWRCATLGFFDLKEELIIDYEMFNISTLLSSEAIEIIGSKENQKGGMSDEEKFRQLKNLKEYIIDVSDCIKSEKYENYYSVKWKKLNTKKFITKGRVIHKTLTAKKYEELYKTDIISEFTL